MTSPLTARGKVPLCALRFCGFMDAFPHFFQRASQTGGWEEEGRGLGINAETCGVAVHSPAEGWLFLNSKGKAQLTFKCVWEISPRHKWC